MRKLLLLTGLSLVLSACGGGGGGDTSSGSSSGGGTGSPPPSGGTNPPPSGGSNNPPPSSGNCVPGTYISLDKANIVVQDANGNILPKNSQNEWVSHSDYFKIIIPYSSDATCVTVFDQASGTTTGGVARFTSSPMVLYCFADMGCVDSSFPRSVGNAPPIYTAYYDISAVIATKGYPYLVSDDVKVRVCVTKLSYGCQ
jgi:hypothetical protein